MRDTVVLVLTLSACVGLCVCAPVISTADQEKAEVNSYEYISNISDTAWAMGDFTVVLKIPKGCFVPFFNTTPTWQLVTFSYLITLFPMNFCKN